MTRTRKRGRYRGPGATFQQSFLGNIVLRSHVYDPSSFSVPRSDMADALRYAMIYGTAMLHSPPASLSRSIHTEIRGSSRWHPAQQQRNRFFYTLPNNEHGGDRHSWTVEETPNMGVDPASGESQSVSLVAEIRAGATIFARYLMPRTLEELRRYANVIMTNTPPPIPNAPPWVRDSPQPPKPQVGRRYRVLIKSVCMATVKLANDDDEFYRLLRPGMQADYQALHAGRDDHHTERTEWPHPWPGERGYVRS